MSEETNSGGVRPKTGKFGEVMKPPHENLTASNGDGGRSVDDRGVPPKPGKFGKPMDVPDEELPAGKEDLTPQDGKSSVPKT